MVLLPNFDLDHYLELYVVAEQRSVVLHHFLPNLGFQYLEPDVVAD